MTTNPYTAMAAAQRDLIERTGEAVTEGLRAQRTMFDAGTEAVETAGDLARETNDLSREGWLTFLDGVEASVPEGGADFETFREVVERSHDATGAGYDRTTEAAVEAAVGGEDATEAFLEAGEAAVDASVEAALEAVDAVEAGEFA